MKRFYMFIVLLLRIILFCRILNDSDQLNHLFISIMLTNRIAKQMCVSFGTTNERNIRIFVFHLFHNFNLY